MTKKIVKKNGRITENEDSSLSIVTNASEGRNKKVYHPLEKENNNEHMDNPNCLKPEE
jgi:hypothetical protein